MNEVESTRGNSVEKYAESSAVPLLHSILNLITSAHVEKYANRVDYVDLNAFEQPSSFAHATKSLALLCDKYISTSGSTVIETLMLGEACSEHCGELKIPCVVCEQWILKSCEQKSTMAGHTLKLNRLKAIEEFFSSAPLCFWLKEHIQPKRHKLTHRICKASKAHAHLGCSFLLPTCQLSPANLLGDDCFPTDKSVYPCKWVMDLPIEHDAVFSHPFPPIPVDSKSAIELCVRIPRRLPSKRPLCEICSSKNSLSVNRLTSIEKSNEPDSMRNASPSTESVEKVSLSTHLEAHRKVIDSPIVLMTDDHFNFLPPDTNSVDHFFSLSMQTFTESGSSTLTKKSRSAPTTESDHCPLESPPRKQPCLSPDTDCQVGNPRTSRSAPMEEVISEFNDLNVVNELITSAGGNLKSGITPASPLYLKSKSDHSSFYLAESDTSSEDMCNSTDQNADASNFQSRKVDNWLASSLTYNSSIDGVMRRERRRNATSTCIPDDSLHDPLPLFHRQTGLPLQSSPVPLRRSTSGRFDFDSSLCRLTPSGSSTSICRRFSNLSSKTCSPSLLSKPTDNSVSTKDTSAPSIRRRPNSLRIPKPPDSDSVGTQHSLPFQRRRTCQVDPNHPELSCSAPPSGNRSSSFRSIQWLTNTLSCMPASSGSSQHLLVNFEESMLNGRIHPVGEVDGFTLELGASGSFVPAHVRLPLKAFFFDLSDDNKPSPYLGYTNLSHLRNGKGYYLPMRGSVQLTLFDPNKSVVKMFIIVYDFEDMPPNSQTFLRQRTVYVPVLKKQDIVYSSATPDYATDDPSGRRPLPTVLQKTRIPTDATSPSLSSCSCSLSSLTSDQTNSSFTSNTDSQSTPHHPPLPNAAYLRYLVHLRFHTTRSGRLYLHTDLRLIFARNKFEFDPRVATYEPQSFTDAPSNPRYSPKKWGKRPRNSTGFIPKIITP